MKGVYYKLPLDFGGLVQQQELSKMTLESSIGQHIFMLMTTCLGECKFDEGYGCEIWNADFDLLRSDNELKNFVTRSLKHTLISHEKRIKLQDIEVRISEQNLGDLRQKRIKKKVIIDIKATILETNRSLFIQNAFFVSPLSY